MNLWGIPNLGDSFDRLAAKVLRAVMENYKEADPEIKSLLENIALLQQAEEIPIDSWENYSVPSGYEVVGWSRCAKSDCEGHRMLSPIRGTSELREE